MSLALNISDSSYDFFDWEIEEAEDRIGEIAGKAFHGRSLVSFVYRHGQTSIQKMYSLPQSLRDQLEAQLRIESLPIRKRQVSKDATVKFLFEVQTEKGPQEVEAVYIPDRDRVTLCVSSQVGCKMGCKFCLTAQLGFISQLRAGDIVRQLWTVNQDPELRPVSNVVFMGMGEPFDNFDEIRKATRILTHHRGLNMSARKITVSTVGLVEKIDEITKEDPFRLAVSLNATNDEMRSQIMPINRRWNLSELKEACQRYTRRTNKKVTFEFILMKGLTDTDQAVEELIEWLDGIRCKLNLIPYNESEHTEFKRPEPEDCLRVHQKLLEAGIPVFTRRNRGNDIYAACGMLKKLSPTI